MKLRTTANVLPKRWKGGCYYGLRFKKTKKILKETTHNKLYKLARWNDACHSKWPYYCYICGMKCIGYAGIKPKRNFGQKPKYKDKPWKKKRRQKSPF